MIIVICGPTCTGKTSLAIKLCQKFNGEIINADSRQIYKGMDVGTNKISSQKSKVKSQKYKSKIKNLKQIIIYGYDLITPDEKFSAFDFSKFGQPKIQEIEKRGKIPFIVGGTGFYIDALLGRVEMSGIGADWELREELGQKSLLELQKMLQELDPSRYQTIDKNNKVRLIRAIEIANKLKVKSQKSKMQFKIQNSKFKIIEVGLNASRELLYQKADQWVSDLAKWGFLEEVKKLIKQGYKNTAPTQGMIYKSGVDFLEGKLSEKEMGQRIKFDIHGYIRRQMTYFKGNKDIRWFDIQDCNFDKEVEKFIQLEINKCKNQSSI